MSLNNRVSVKEVARILSLIADPPNWRDDPNNPNHIMLFDGGLVRIHTGHMNYEFSDGTTATVSVLQVISVGITFPDGSEVSVVQEKASAVQEIKDPVDTAPLDPSAIKSR